MPKPLLIIVNGPPGAGKTTLARRLAQDLQLPVIHRDGVAETLFDALESQTYGRPPLFGPASFIMTHYFAAIVLAAGQSLIVEGSFPNPELAGREFLQLKQAHDFAPIQVQCRAKGAVLLERFLARAETPERHICHRDVAFAEHNKEVILRERFADLPLGGQVIDIDTTDVDAYDYVGLLQKLRREVEKRV